MRTGGGSVREFRGPPEFWRTHAVEACVLLAVLAVAGWLRFSALDGLGNLFYASTVRSMGRSWYPFWDAA